MTKLGKMRNSATVNLIVGLLERVLRQKPTVSLRLSRKTKLKILKPRGTSAVVAPNSNGSNNRRPRRAKFKKGLNDLMKT